MTKSNFIAQIYPANWRIRSVKLNFFLPFHLRILMISILILSLTACAHRSRHWKINTAWENLIAQERSQPNSIILVDNSVIAYMKKYNVPGLSIAIAKDDKLIYVKAYGYADVTTQERVTDSSLFRLASVSKPITGIAIMKLIQDGKLSLNSKVFGDSGILGNDYGPLPDDTNLKNITIDELLHHTCGGWPNDIEDPMGEDPMFSHPSFNSSQLITWTLNHQPLKNPPGTAYAYSNFGYFLLGRVIEKVTGQSYADYVNASILRPVGITDMQIGDNSQAAKKPNEVVYYEEGNEPYICNLSRMDAGGGWIASATDLLKLIVSVDGLNSKKAILDSSTIRAMLTPSTANPNYACGWALSSYKGFNWFHFGELMGTTTMLAHTHIGFSWAILTNTGYQNEQNSSDLDHILWNAINDSTTRWPDKDLF
jgi:D-alanyl-D-alanine carboxypeptidase